MNYKIYNEDCLKAMEELEENSIDSIVTDPPYELNFMGKGWDNVGISFNKETWEKCLRVLKPGGYLLAFGGSRTFHRIACAIENAGFEIRDTIMWLYGSGFPKSMDISKQIDKRPNRSYENLNLFGKKLKEQRELKGYSKNDIDKMMGTNTAYAWWEGRNYLGEFKIQLPDKENYKKLKKILELNDDMDFIFEEAEREVIGTKKSGGASAWINGMNNKENEEQKYTGFSEWEITAPATDLAKQWQGWGTALKPSFEPIIVARKPFKGSLVDNVIEYGVGGINIDECRVEISKNDFEINTKKASKNPTGKKAANVPFVEGVATLPNELGRFPANTILTYDETDFDEVCGGFPYTKAGIAVRHNSGGNTFGGNNKKPPMEDLGYNDNGSASRYFYCAKASKKDRDEGLDEFEQQKVNDGRKKDINNAFQRGITLRHNIHPTVKPTELMQYLVRLVTPKGGIILDPFMGSGSTGKAVMFENKERQANYKFIGIEREKEYCDIAEARIKWADDYKEPKENENQISIDEFIKE